MLLFWTSYAAAQVVQGTVVNSVTGSPIAGVKVDLYWSGDMAYTTTSDAQGHFLFDHVEDGLYTAGYSSPDYEWADFFLAPHGPGRIQVAAGNPVTLEAHMMPMGRLTGRVVNALGEPVSKAQLEVIGPGMQVAIPTDADGKFDLHKFLFPGAYTLSAAPPAGLKPPDPDPETGRPMAWTRTWYPGVTDPDAAAKIVLRPGGEMWNIEWKLLAAPAHAVSGVIVKPDGKPAAKVEIALDGRSADLRTTSAGDGGFQFPAVVDGQWLLSAEMDGGTVPPQKLRARRPLEMAGHDREDLKLQLNAPFTVRGKVIMETAPGIAPPRARVVGLVQRDRAFGASLPRGRPVTARPDENGDFLLQPVYPGPYEIGPLGPPGYYLDSIRFGDAELTTPEVELAPGAVPITVIFKTNGGTVRGTVENCASGWVVLVPREPAMRWQDFIRQERCDENGRYQVPAVRPGDYYVLAFAQDAASIFWAPHWDDALLGQASQVTVRAGESATADLSALPPGQ